MCFRIQVMRIKNKQGNDAATDSRIGKVKNRAEENKVITSYKRHPVRPVGIDNREVEHIDHLAMQPVGISLPQWNPRSNLRMSTLAEYLSIEHTVDDVTHCAGQNQGKTNQVTILHLVRPFHQFHQIDRNQYSSHDTEKRQEQFGKNLQTKSHTVVFRKIDIKPVKSHEYSHANTCSSSPQS